MTNGITKTANCYIIERFCYWENDSKYVYIKFIGVANNFLTWLANSANHIFQIIVTLAMYLVKRFVLGLINESRKSPEIDSLTNCGESWICGNWMRSNVLAPTHVPPHHTPPTFPPSPFLLVLLHCTSPTPSTTVFLSTPVIEIWSKYSSTPMSNYLHLIFNFRITINIFVCPDVSNKSHSPRDRHLCQT